MFLDSLSALLFMHIFTGTAPPDAFT